MIPEEAARALGERHKVRIVVSDEATHRLTRLMVVLQPLRYQTQTEMSRTFFEDSSAKEALLELDRIVADSARVMRGAIVSDMFEAGDCNITRGAAPDSHLVAALCTVLERGDEMSPELAHRLGERLVYILTQRASSEVCEHLAITLMQRVESIRPR